MKNLDRKVTLLCPLCGNDQFSSLDEEPEDLLHAGDDARVRCSDCGSEYTKRELLDMGLTFMISHSVLVVVA